MAYETKEKSGAFFENENKTADNQPDYTGNFKLDGKMWRIAGWARKSTSGKVYLSLAISEPQERTSNVGQDDPEFQRMRQQMRERGQQIAKERFGRDPQDDFADDDVPF